MLGLGGGMLDQMNKTLKQNRDNLKRTLPKPFDKDRLSDKWKVETERLKDAPAMSENDRARFIQRIQDERRRSRFIRLAILSLFVLIGVVILVKVVA